MSVQFDETSNCAMYAQLLIIIQYVYEDKTRKWFLGFFDVSDEKSSTRQADAITTALNSFSNITNKLVSQIYDGAAVMAGTLNRVQNKLRDNRLKHTRFIHWYAHKINLVLSKSAEKASRVNLFFLIYAHLVNLHHRVVSGENFSGSFMSVSHRCVKQDGVIDQELYHP